VTTAFIRSLHGIFIAARDALRMIPHHRSSTAGVLALAAMFGGVVGIGSVAATPQGRATVMEAGKSVAVASGAMRRRAPQDGDLWGGCRDARAAGTAPIYRGEPGYRAGMDGDGDGIACEPYYG